MWARIPVEVQCSSEFRYGDPIIDEETLVRRHHAVGRDRRHARRRARGARARREGHRDHQRRRLARDARVRRRHLHARRSGDRRCGHQDVHRADRRAHGACAQARAGQGHAVRRARRRRCSTSCARFPRSSRRSLQDLRRSRVGRSDAFVATRELAVPRPRLRCAGGDGRRAQAQGDLLHPRRGVSGRRDEARSDRAHHRRDAGRRSWPRRVASTRRS